MSDVLLTQHLIVFNDYVGPLYYVSVGGVHFIFDTIRVEPTRQYS